MRNLYIVAMTNSNQDFYRMPWLFTSMKEACLYGEYKYREGDCESYRIERLVKPYPFYKL